MYFKMVQLILQKQAIILLHRQNNKNVMIFKCGDEKKKLMGS